MNEQALRDHRLELLVSIAAHSRDLSNATEHYVLSRGTGLDMSVVRDYGMKLFAEIEQLSNVETILRNIQ